MFWSHRVAGFYEYTSFLIRVSEMMPTHSLIYIYISVLPTTSSFIESGAQRQRNSRLCAMNAELNR